MIEMLVGAVVFALGCLLGSWLAFRRQNCANPIWPQSALSVDFEDDGKEREIERRNAL